MKTVTLVLIVLLSMLFSGCQQEKQEAGEEEVHEVGEGVIDMHTAEIALDYAGVYRGVLPTASGAGAEVTIELKGVEGSGLYFVAENHIVHLDENGDRIYSELSDHYVLEKVTDSIQ